MTVLDYIIKRKTSPEYRLLCFLLVVLCGGCTITDAGARGAAEPLLFEDSGTEDWRDKWFLDGVRCAVINNEKGMELIAGPEARNDTCHAVLWTKQVFNGDIRIAYDYTRTDSSTQFVNILYFMATGKGDKAYPTDITLWNDKRRVSHMRTYFNNMKTYHISYAAYGPDPGPATDDYVRLRRYNPMVGGLKGTAIAGDQFTTGLFRPGVTYHIEVVKRGARIEMNIQNTAEEAERARYLWDASDASVYDTGRVGLRHMYTRSARYKNIRISSLE